MSISWCFRKRDIYFSGTSCPHQSAKFFRDISITHVTEPSSRDCALLQLITPRAAQQSCFKISMDTYLFAPGKSQCIFQIGNTITNITTTETLFYNIDILFWRIVSALPFHWRRHQWLQLCIKNSNMKNFAVYIHSIRVPYGIREHLHTHESVLQIWDLCPSFRIFQNISTGGNLCCCWSY
jgi:hypothetical protein